jgi:hypothetical protein
VTARLLVLLVVGLFIAGGVVAILQPWNGTLGPAETASMLRQRLQTSDQFDCHEPSGTRPAGEPDWTYICIDLSHSDRQGYFVLTSGKRITAIQPAG